MTFFYCYNPKVWIDPGWIEALADPIKRKKHAPEIEKALEVVKASRPKDSNLPVRTKELDAKVSEFIGISQKIASLEKQISELEGEEQAIKEILSLQDAIMRQQRIVANRLLEMEEEEQAMLLMLMF